MRMRRRRRRRRRKWLLRMVLKLTPKRATTTLKTTTVRKQNVVALKRPPPFTLKIPVNIVSILKRTEHWSWNVLTASGTITTRFVRSAITRSPRREIPSKRAFFGVTIVEQLHAKKWRRWKPIFIFLLKRRTKKRINFSFLSNRCVFDSLCHWFSIKFLKRYLVSGFIVSVYYSRVLIDPSYVFYCFVFL